MPSSYTTRLRLEKQADGENANTWGDRLNQQVIDMVDEAVGGVLGVAITTSVTTLSTNNGATDQARNAVVRVSGNPGVTSCTIEIPNNEKVYTFTNQTTGVTTLTVKRAGGGTGVNIPLNGSKIVYCDGANMHDAVNATGVSALALEGGTVPGFTVSGTVSATSFVGTKIVATTSLTSGNVSVTGDVNVSGGIAIGSGNNKGKQLRITKSAVADIVSVATSGTSAHDMKPDFGTAQNFVHVLKANSTLANPVSSTCIAGQTGSFFIIQNAAGSNTLSFKSNYKFVGGTAPTLTTTACATDRIDYIVQSSSSIHMQASLDIKTPT
tara:strand:- start:991 stop:1962 length:972 start_codon:yes stop_codon:yes gene_type:complete